jgi:regulatory protein
VKLANKPTNRPALTLQGRAVQWLAQRDHSRHELRGKLLRWAQAQGAAEDDPAAGIDAVLDALERRGLLSDARFVESRVRTRAARFGNRRIEAELRQRGVPPDAATQAALRASELERARTVWQARFGGPPADPRERARQQRFLAGRGFSAEVIRKVIAGPDEAD